MQSAPQSTALPWRLRRDLAISESGVESQQWVIKDPLNLSYFSIDQEEYAFLQRLDGKTSLKKISEELTLEYPDVEFSKHSLMSFLASAVKSGLLVPETVGYGEVLALKHRAVQNSAKFRKLFSLISHRFRGIDPTPILRVMHRWGSGIFHRRVQWTLAGFIVLVAGLVLSRWGQLTSELPTISQLLTPGNLIVLSCSVALIKLIHEFGHALTCHHYGGECHELGVMVVGFFPLLYCDVSDSWLQQDRLKRMHVAAAGIVVELFLAACCGVLWMTSVPGAMHSFFLNIMLLCSLNTVLVNGNPLLRYDGYYMLCDLLQMPNLGPHSRDAAISIADRIVLGIRNHQGQRMATWRSIAMPIFGTASLIYRWVVLITILLVINRACQPLRLESISYLLAISMAAGVVLSTFGFIRQRWMAMQTSQGINLRAISGVLFTLLLLIAGLLVPLPYSVEAPCTLSPGVSAAVYVQTPGQIEAPAKKYGETVSEGQLIASLKNPDVQLILARMEGQVQTAITRVTYLSGTRQTVEGSAAALPAAEIAVENAEKQLASANSKVARLSLKSPRSGLIRPPRNRTAPTPNRFAQQFWTGRPLDQKNSRAWLEEQTVVAWVGDESDLRVVCFVAQRDIEFVSGSSEATIRFDSVPGDVFAGRVTQLNQAPEVAVPPELAVNSTVAADQDGTPLATVFAAYVAIEPTRSLRMPPLYTTGRVMIKCQPRSITSRLWRLLKHTFAFDI